MEAIANVSYRHQSLPLSLHHHRPSFSRSISFPFRITSSPSPLSLKSSSFSSLIATRASFSNPLLPNLKNHKPRLFNILTPLPSLLKTTFIVAVTATALLFSRFNIRPVIAAPISSPPMVETSTSNAVSAEEKEKNLEEYLDSHPEDVQALRNLVELKMKSGKVHEAIVVIDQLIELEPDDSELQLLKAHIHCMGGDQELARKGFNEILSKDPTSVEAYHGLVTVASQTASTNEMKKVEKRVVEGMEKCKKEKKNEDVRDFKLLLAQIRVIEGDYNEALMIYLELIKEDPMDFRPYLCQGIVYTLLRKTDDAEKSFQKYRRLVPKGHPYTRYFDENTMATKLYAQKVENERAYSKN